MRLEPWTLLAHTCFKHTHARTHMSPPHPLFFPHPPTWPCADGLSGADKTQDNPLFVDDESSMDDECGVCLENMAKIVIRPCKHRICGECSLEEGWLNSG